ncbi:hypothetical protein MKI84_17015 [Ancylobacter sp. A5.8]|uniref:hypothetical protein n=1 Tax=Ancylobacter gelatini TaxID=2919920 RepID=UPI001F4EEAAC|nr:hypothetical protein [Ancylobacter gelatini]MCJ8144626.1 hypothetical protein [Ancylobacter gelatini]
MADRNEGAAGADNGESVPRTRPPQDPEAFARWLGLETLKADLKRLELEKLRYAQEQQRIQEQQRAQEQQRVPEAPGRPGRGGLMLGSVALVLVLLLAALAGYLAARLDALNGEVARLSMTQADLKDALEAVDAQLSVAAAAPVPAAPVSGSSSQLTWSPPPGVSSRPVAPESIPVATPGAPAAAAASAAPADPAPADAAAPAAQADAFSVRVFGSANANLKNRMEAFASVVKGAGFKVEVSSNDVFQPLNNSILFHASAAAKAEELARVLKAKYPKIQFDMKLSEAITDSMRRIIIVNLTDESLN